MNDPTTAIFDVEKDLPRALACNELRSGPLVTRKRSGIGNDLPMPVPLRHECVPSP